MVLHHIISDQVWQNLVPLLALRPAKVVQYCSIGEHWLQIAAGVKEAARLGGLNGTRFYTQTVPKEFPGFSDWGTAIQKAFDSQPADVFNLTGGTKLASIAAHRVCLERGIPSFYYDTRHPVFDGGTGKLPPMEPPSAIIRALTVKVALSAHGYAADKFSSEVPSPEWESFGSRAATLFARHKPILRRWLEKCRAQFCPENHWPEKERLKKLLQMPLPAPVDDASQEYADAAVEAGLLRADHDGLFYLLPDPLEFRDSSRLLRNESRRNFMIMDGGWWELHVYSRLRLHPSLADVRWSVRINQDTSAGETDIVALNAEAFRLELISCKSGHIQKSLEHCESLRARATAMGGYRAQPILAVFSFDDSRQEDSVRLHAQAHQVKILTYPDLD